MLNAPFLIPFLEPSLLMGVALNEKPPANDVTPNLKRPATGATPPDSRKQFNALCAANLQRPRDVEEKSTTARNQSKSILIYDSFVNSRSLS